MKVALGFSACLYEVTWTRRRWLSEFPSEQPHQATQASEKASLPRTAAKRAAQFSDVMECTTMLLEGGANVVVHPSRIL